MDLGNEFSILTFLFCFVSLISVKYWRFLSENGFPLCYLLNFLSCLKMFLGSVKELVVCFIGFIVLSVTSVYTEAES